MVLTSFRFLQGDGTSPSSFLIEAGHEDFVKKPSAIKPAKQ